MMNPDDLPEGDPWPYSEAERKKIAELLDLPISDLSVEFVTGIGRQFKADEADPPHARRARRLDQRRDEAEAMEQAATALEILERHTGKGGLSTLGLHGDAMLTAMKLRAMIRGGYISGLAEELRRKANEEDMSGTRGRPAHEHLTVALMQLIFVWEDVKGKARGRNRFIEAAMTPLGWTPGDDAMKAEIKKALRTLKG